MAVIFPSLFGLVDFALDIYYVFIKADFENHEIKHVAWLSIFLSPFISLVAWLLLFS